MRSSPNRNLRHLQAGYRLPEVGAANICYTVLYNVDSFLSIELLLLIIHGRPPPIAIVRHRNRVPLVSPVFRVVQPTVA